MICTSCGKEIDDNMKFCGYCGAGQVTEETGDDFFSWDEFIKASDEEKEAALREYAEENFELENYITSDDGCDILGVLKYDQDTKVLNYVLDGKEIFSTPCDMPSVSESGEVVECFYQFLTYNNPGILAYKNDKWKLQNLYTNESVSIETYNDNEEKEELTELDDIIGSIYREMVVYKSGDKFGIVSLKCDDMTPCVKSIVSCLYDEIKVKGSGLYIGRIDQRVDIITSKGIIFRYTEEAYKHVEMLEIYSKTLEDMGSSSVHLAYYREEIETEDDFIEGVSEYYVYEIDDYEWEESDLHPVKMEDIYFDDYGRDGYSTKTYGWKKTNDSGVYILRERNNIGLIREFVMKHGKEVSNLVGDDITNVGFNMYIVTRDKFKGVYDETGKVVIPSEFTNIRYCRDIDEKKRMILESIFDDEEFYINGFYILERFEQKSLAIISSSSNSIVKYGEFDARLLEERKKGINFDDITDDTDDVINYEIEIDDNMFRVINEDTKGVCFESMFDAEKIIDTYTNNKGEEVESEQGYKYKPYIYGNDYLVYRKDEKWYIYSLLLEGDIEGYYYDDNDEVKKSKMFDYVSNADNFLGEVERVIYNFDGLYGYIDIDDDKIVSIHEAKYQEIKDCSWNFEQVTIAVEKTEEDEEYGMSSTYKTDLIMNKGKVRLIGEAFKSVKEAYFLKDDERIYVVCDDKFYIREYESESYMSVYGSKFDNQDSYDIIFGKKGGWKTLLVSNKQGIYEFSSKTKELRTIPMGKKALAVLKRKDAIICEDNGYVGMINGDCEVIVPFKYSKIGSCEKLIAEDTFFILDEFGKKGLGKKEKGPFEYVIACDYESIKVVSGNIILGEEGKAILPVNESDKFVQVIKMGRKAYYDLNGMMVYDFVPVTVDDLKNNEDKNEEKKVEASGDSIFGDLFSDIDFDDEY